MRTEPDHARSIPESPHCSSPRASARLRIGRRRRAESDGQWRKRYGLRAGIEGTNSEMKRCHGLGRLRVRGGERVRLAVYLKALACNLKRMVRARLEEMLVPRAVLATTPTHA